ncbi:unnamed protein product [Lampetra planeri]
MSIMVHLEAEQSVGPHLHENGGRHLEVSETAVRVPDELRHRRGGTPCPDCALLRGQGLRSFFGGHGWNQYLVV